MTDLLAEPAALHAFTQVGCSLLAARHSGMPA
jgi:hypothetical protein